jgi:hypothetical protein
LTKFDISKNKIRAEGGKALAVGLKGNQAIIELNIAGNELGWDANVDDDMSGIVALADVIPGMGALYSLDLSANNLGSKGAKVLAKMLKTGPLLCEDGKFFKSKGMLAQSTCKHCGDKKSTHGKGKGALSVVVARDNYILSAEEVLLRSACGGAGAALTL